MIHKEFMYVERFQRIEPRKIMLEFPTNKTVKHCVHTVNIFFVWKEEKKNFLKVAKTTRRQGYYTSRIVLRRFLEISEVPKILLVCSLNFCTRSPQ